jgi:hypothetical protein
LHSSHRLGGRPSLAGTENCRPQSRHTKVRPEWDAIAAGFWARRGAGANWLPSHAPRPSPAGVTVAPPPAFQEDTDFLQ